ncbi:SphA family protein [Pseudomonas aeruginosa]|uniref:SphA family protein n=1 Tax=Pseudomonas aeruginosa TaxID=287 RepID=UPI003FCF6FC1
MNHGTGPAFSLRRALPLNLLGGMGLLLADSALAALPGVNLGMTSFEDAKGGPGSLFQQFVSYSRADDFKDADGRRRPGNDRLTSTLFTTHLAHITDYRLFGAYYGFEAVFVYAQLDPDFNPNVRSANGVGNLSVAPVILQWPQTELFGRPYWQRLNLIFQLPNGEYDRRNALNPSSNVWAFNPYYAATWEFAPRWELSTRLSYLYSGKNDDPNPAIAERDMQPGKALHANYSVSYALDEHWGIGLSGYSLRQITDEQADGHDRPDSRERVDGIGPALRYRWGHSSLYLNTYQEYGVRNRGEGSRLILRYSLTF